MPELPEVETVVKGLKPQIGGKVLLSDMNSGKNLRYPLPNFAACHGATLKNIERRAKYLLFHFDNGQTLIWHLGMTGQFHVLSGAEPAAKHEHVCLGFSDGCTLRYRDTRRFGYAGLCQTSDLETHKWFKDLGIEPLTTDFDGQYLKGKLSSRKTSIKQGIMDNHVVVGVGNIYVSESLFRAKINPQQTANSINTRKLNTLAKHIQDVLNEAIIAGGSTISDFVKADGKPGYFAHSFKVYGRVGEPCLTCDKPIQKIVLGGRASFFCPKCQIIK
ncbi:bifunctional DNA-formamidopyrimidine glycosylase/DNA-(apurinic or apyrimidinic site) lyase [Ghiorsea bivora]|uniref:bifunctional DNA-formamidopyrimidine glycosylase/DNA-(apurinic or apyrimidinic site) lyase n=1 Tax=Ghiorsea bivora TaxID=1485545 RepID=UPI00056F1728|nr:bifunctional DNA-formamidopyrimidine glycosylase/DNA-(apurinic or apyrimidinic site) lyase [Ghiorsea bivora]